MSPAIGSAPDSTATCDHGDVTFGIDPDPVYLRPCNEGVVFYAPIEAVPGPIGLCPYHLARYLEAIDERLEAELVERGAREHVDGGFVTIDEAPPLFVTEDDEGVTKVWSRAAIDQRGRAHYQRPEEEAALRLDSHLNEEFDDFGDGGFPGYMESVRISVGFAAFDEDLSIPTGAADPEHTFRGDDVDVQDDEAELLTDGGTDRRDLPEDDPRIHVVDELRFYHPHRDEQLRTDGGVVDLLELSEGARAALFAIRELEGEDTVLVDPNELAEYLEDHPNGSSRLHLRNNLLPDLEERGLLHGEPVPVRGQKDPRWYATTDAGRAALEALVEQLAEQIGLSVQRPGTTREPLEDADPIELDGWQTVGEREDRSSDRVVDEPFCPRCGSVYAGEGLCEACEDNVEDELVADGGRSHHDFDDLVGAEDVDRPGWASGFDVGDVVTFESPAGEHEERIIGFSTKRHLEGQPAVLVPEQVEDLFPDGTELLVLREQDVDLEDEVATDGGHEPSVVDAGDRVGIGVERDDVQASILLPKDAEAADVVAVLGRLETAAKNELHFRQVVGEPTETQPDDADGTKYGHQGVGEDVLTDGGREPVTVEHLIAVCAVVEPGDEVELAHAHHDYANPLSVADSKVVRWLGGGWRTARLVLEGAYGAEHAIIGVDGDEKVFDHSGQSAYPVYQLDPVGADPEDAGEEAGPLAPADSPHKYTTNGALDDLDRALEDEEELDPLVDGERRPWSELDVRPPPDLTPGDLEAAVENADRLYDVCRELGLRPTDRGMVRVLLVNEGLYHSLEMPEARRRPSSAEDELLTDGGHDFPDPAAASPAGGRADDVDEPGTNRPGRRTSPSEASFRNRDVGTSEHIFTRQQRELGPAHRLEEIAKQARILRDELDLEAGDVQELAGITAVVRRLAQRHGYDLDQGRIAGEGGGRRA